MTEPTKPNDMLQSMHIRRDRGKNKRGASHAVNPAGTKIARAFEKRVWCGRARGPYA